MREHHSHHYHYRAKFNYPVSFAQRLYSFAISPVIFLVAVILLVKIFALFPQTSEHEVSLPFLLTALGATFLRMIAAYVAALICAVPLALLATRNRFTNTLLLPLFDIIESVPVLVFFPIIIIIFIRLHFYNGAAIFIIFINMLWNIVFNIIGGLNVIPNDIKNAAVVYKFDRMFYLRKVILPAVFPQVVTGSLLAWAEGWNMIIVAEVLHTYIPGGTASSDLFGIGSILVNSSAVGENGIFIASIVCIVVAIAFLNFFVWQKLLHYAERFKFE